MIAFQRHKYREVVALCGGEEAGTAGTALKLASGVAMRQVSSLGLEEETREEGLKGPRPVTGRAATRLASRASARLASSCRSAASRRGRTGTKGGGTGAVESARGSPELSKLLLEHLAFVEGDEGAALELARFLAGGGAARGSATPLRKGVQGLGDGWWLRVFCARVHADKQRWVNAGGELQLALRRQPTLRILQPHILYAECLLQTGRPRRASTFLRGAIDFFGSISALLHPAASADPSASLSFKAAAVQAAPHRTAMVSSLARGLRQAGRPRLALRLAASGGENLLASSACFFDADRRVEALRCARAALASAGSAELQADCWFNLGCFLLGMQDLSFAKLCLETALRKHPPHAEAANNLAGLLAKEGKVEQAEALLIQAAGVLFEARFNLALLRFKVGRFAEALKGVSECLVEFPVHPESTMVQRACLAKLGLL